MSREPVIRRATVADIDALVELRMALLESQDGEGAVNAEVRRGTHAFLLPRLADGSFLSWVAEADGRLVACSGLVLRHWPPSAADLAGIEAYVYNMFTDPAWRGRGLATALMHQIIAYCRAAHAARITLNATAMGRPVYERLGFTGNSAGMQLLLT